MLDAGDDFEIFTNTFLSVFLLLASSVVPYLDLLLFESIWVTFFLENILENNIFIGFS